MTNKAIKIEKKVEGVEGLNGEDRGIEGSVDMEYKCRSVNSFQFRIT